MKDEEIPERRLSNKVNTAIVGVLLSALIALFVLCVELVGKQLDMNKQDLVDFKKDVKDKFLELDREIERLRDRRR